MKNNYEYYRTNEDALEKDKRYLEIQHQMFLVITLMITLSILQINNKKRGD